jgi:hypothetical protein
MLSGPFLLHTLGCPGPFKCYPSSSCLSWVMKCAVVGVAGGRILRIPDGHHFGLGAKTRLPWAPHFPESSLEFKASLVLSPSTSYSAGWDGV